MLTKLNFPPMGTGCRNLSSAIANPLHFCLRFAHVEFAPFQIPVGRVHFIGCWPRDASFVVFDLFDVSLGLGHVKFPNIGTALQPLDCFHLFVCALDAIATKQSASCTRCRVVETARGGLSTGPGVCFPFISAMSRYDTGVSLPHLPPLMTKGSGLPYFPAAHQLVSETHSVAGSAHWQRHLG